MIPTKDFIEDIYNTNTEILSNAHAKVQFAIMQLLAPFGEKGIELNDKINGMYFPSVEVAPGLHKQIKAIRFYNEILYIKVEDNWIFYKNINDLPFLFSEIYRAIESELF